MKKLQSDRMKAVGLNTKADIFEFISAVEEHISNVSNIKIYESVSGTAKALASLLKRDDEGINKVLLEMFNAKCVFIAGWNVDDMDSDYSVKIDMSRVSVLSSLKLIGLDKKLKKADKENEKVDSILKGLVYKKR